MGDLISRQEALEAMDTWDKFGCGPDGKLVRYDDDNHYVPYVHYDDMVHVITHLPSAQQWIPCSERLPEEYGEYRITWTTSASKKQFVGDSEYEITSEWDDEHYRFKGEWLLDDYIKNYPDVKVIAWKPIEEPYKENPDAD